MPLVLHRTHQRSSPRAGSRERISVELRADLALVLGIVRGQTDSSAPGNPSRLGSRVADERHAVAGRHDGAASLPRLRST